MTTILWMWFLLLCWLFVFFSFCDAVPSVFGFWMHEMNPIFEYPNINTNTKCKSNWKLISEWLSETLESNALLEEK